MDETRIKELRKDGIMIQKDKTSFLVRFGLCGGQISPTLLREVADIAEKFAGYAHLTTRQTLEVHGVGEDKIEELVSYIKEKQIPLAPSGPRLRTIIACPGAPICRFSAGKTTAIAEAIREQFGSYEGLNTKVKVAISGCPNACAKPQFNDIGLIAAGKHGYRLFYGGKMGRNPQMGAEYPDKLPDTCEILRIVGKIFDWLLEKGQEKERLADTINRLGSEEFLAYLWS